MKLVSYEEFIKMPAGTIFAPFTPCVFEERLAIKTDTGNVYPEIGTQHLFCGVMPLEPWLGDYNGLRNIGDQEDASFEICDGDNADYVDYKMFAVLEEQDVKKLMKVLEWALKGCEGEYDENL